MLTIYRRHLKSCSHRNEGRGYRRCQCPIWADGLLGATDMRLSLDTRNWELAQAKVCKWEAEGRGPLPVAEPVAAPMTIARACQQFKEDAIARNLKDKTIYKYRILFRQLEEATRGLALEQVDLGLLNGFRATWNDKNMASLNKLGRLRCFFRFCRDNGWIKENPADRMKNPRVSQMPTLPFTQEEMFAILKKLAGNIETASPSARHNARRLRTLVLMLRYSGLRIGDAVSCSAERLVDGKLRLYTQKTGQHVHCPLPDFVVKELETTPRTSERYWFWTGNGKLESAVSKWQVRLKKVFASIELPSGKGIQHGHAHRFRDTFAVDLLLNAVPIERVSIMLGHSSVKITEKHYSPWVRERQEQVEADVRRSWLRDPVVLLEGVSSASSETKGTQ